ncbi:hypothetical protein VTK73DRAFT_5066 [Phialemonium thermophilum]|uniref:Shikimate dehydrogenase substrate binding N-terminal domain-containing protein n=1 Tax=Phialemonium thermophilum TaxID=223376 RepID=A0ABR3WQ59_9PEZI
MVIAAGNEERRLHLVGVGVSHSIAYAMHNHIAQSLGLPWTFHSTECPTLEDALAIGRDPATAGLVVTMPYKTSIIPHLDGLDEVATAIGACNNVYYGGGDPRRLLGTNTDWRGILGCLKEKKGDVEPGSDGEPITAVVVGAGGASRAAVYALASHLNVSVIHVLNRDDQEVHDLIRDSARLPKVPRIVHVKSLEQASRLPHADYVVGTVPDFEPKTEQEKTVASILRSFLERPRKGVLLDMCFKPRRTRTIKLAESLGWPTVEGIHVIGYQMDEQWRLWAGEEKAKSLDKEGAWRVLLKAAEESKSINF